MISRREHDRQKALRRTIPAATPAPVTTMSEAWVIEAYHQIMESRQDPLDRRYAAKEIERIRDPKAFATEELRQRQLRQLRAEADEKVTTVCPHCGQTGIPFVTSAAPGEHLCPNCKVDLGVDLDPGMYEPSRLGETVPKT